MADIIKTSHTFEIAVDYDSSSADEEGFSDSRKISFPIKLFSGEDGAAASTRWTEFVSNTYNSEVEGDAKFKNYWRLLFQPNNWLDSPSSDDEDERPITVDKISASYVLKSTRDFEEVVQ